jgi:hypothetical protein
MSSWFDWLTGGEPDEEEVAEALEEAKRDQERQERQEFEQEYEPQRKNRVRFSRKTRRHVFTKGSKLSTSRRTASRRRE